LNKSCGDPILKVDQLTQLVAENRVRFALIGDGSRGLRRVFGEDGQKPLTDWIQENGRLVDPALWRSAAPIWIPEAGRRRW